MAGFGSSIKLDGESEYQRALKQINQSLKEVSSEMKVVSSSFDKNDKSTQAMAQKSDVLNKKLEEQKNKLSILTQKYNEMNATYGKNSTAQQQLTSELTKEKAKLDEIGSTLGKTSKEYQAQEKVVNQLENKQVEYNNAVSKAKTEMNQAQAEINKTTKELDDLGKEEVDVTKKTKEAGDGFTVFKGILANLGTQAINGAINGLKSMGNALINVGKQAIESYAEYEQLVGGVETLFGESAGVVEEYANNAYKSAGLSANQYMETVTSFSASLLQSLDGDTQKAAEYSNRAIIDMSDNANKMGTSMESLQNAYQGFAKGNYQMLDSLKLGYGGTKTEMARLIQDASKLTDVQKELGITVDANDMSFGNIVNAISVVQKEMGIMGTTSKEASTTISGSVSAMKSAWSNLLTGIADDNANFEQLVGNFVDSLITALSNLLPRIHNVIQGIGTMATTLLQEIVPKLLPIIVDSLFEMIPTLVDTVKIMIQSVLDVLPTIVDAVSDLIPEIIGALLEMLPQLIDVGIKGIISLIQGITEALPQLIKMLPDIIKQTVEVLMDNLPLLIDAGIEILMALLDGIIEALPILIDYLPEMIDKIITTLSNNMPKLVQAGITLIIKLAEGLIKAIPQLISKIPQIISSLVSGFANYYSELGKVGLNLIKGLWEGIVNAKDWLLGKIKGFAKSVLDGFKSFFGIHSPSTVFRDTIGKNLALGLGEGFTDEMKNVTNEMQSSLPTNFDINGSYNRTNGTSSINYQDNYNSIVEAFKTALSEMKIELDDDEMGKFVDKTVARTIYS